MIFSAVFFTIRCRVLRSESDAVAQDALDRVVGAGPSSAFSESRDFLCYGAGVEDHVRFSTRWTLRNSVFLMIYKGGSS